MTKNLTDSVRSAGYDREEEYFHRLNEEQLTRMHAEAALNHCPGCGAALQASADPGLPGHICPECGGVFLKRDHLQELAASKSHGLRDHAKRWLQALTKPLPTGIGQFPV